MNGKFHHAQGYSNDRMYSYCHRCDRRHAGCYGHGPACQCKPEDLKKEKPVDIYDDPRVPPSVIDTIEDNPDYAEHMTAQVRKMLGWSQFVDVVDEAAFEDEFRIFLAESGIDRDLSFR